MSIVADFPKRFQHHSVTVFIGLSRVIVKGSKKAKVIFAADTRSVFWSTVYFLEQAALLIKA